MFQGFPIPAISSALCYYDGMRSAQLPHNLLQAQRDYFGAHTYERTGMILYSYSYFIWFILILF